MTGPGLTRGPAAGLGHGHRRGAAATREPKRRPNMSNAWKEARELIWRHRTQLTLGLVLMLINRLAGLVLPASSKVLIDRVIGQHRGDLLVPLAAAPWPGAGAVVFCAAPAPRPPAETGPNTGSGTGGPILSFHESWRTA